MAVGHRRRIRLPSKFAEKFLICLIFTKIFEVFFEILWIFQEYFWKISYFLKFQSFCQYKASPSKRTKEELEDLAQMESQVKIYFWQKLVYQQPDLIVFRCKLWNLYPVMNILYSLVKKSQINEQLVAINRGGKVF